MSRKDYIAIAAVFRHVAAEHTPDSPGRVTVDTLAEDVASVLQNDNPRFDRSRFLTACKAKE